MAPHPPTEHDENDHELNLDEAHLEPTAHGDDTGADSVSVLQQRLTQSQTAQADALKELREVMTDEDTLADYGVDTSQL